MKRLNFSEIIEASLPSKLCISVYLPPSETLSSSKEQEAQLNSVMTEVRALCSKSKLDWREDLLTQMKNQVHEIKSLQSESGVAWFISEQVTGYFPCQWNQSPFAVVADTFHVKPLFRDLQNEAPYWTLVITGKAVKLLHHWKGKIKLIESSTLGMKDDEELENFRESHRKNRSKLRVNQAEISNEMLMKHLNHSKDPVILAGTTSTISEIRSKLNYPYVLQEGVACKGDNIDLSLLKQKCNEVVQSHLERVEDEILEDLRYCQKSKKSLTELHDIAQASVQGKVEHLIIAEDHHEWGMLDHHTGEIQYHSTQKNAEDADILDDLSEMVYRHKGSVWVVPKKKLGEGSVFATLRW